MGRKSSLSYELTTLRIPGNLPSEAMLYQLQGEEAIICKKYMFSLCFFES